MHTENKDPDHTPRFLRKDSGVFHCFKTKEEAEREIEKLKEKVNSQYLEFYVVEVKP